MSDSIPVISYAAELKRKAIHLGALALPLGILVLGREPALWLLGPLAVFAISLDLARQRIPSVHRVIDKVFASIMRPEEQPPFGGPLVLNGAVWMCLSAFVCALLFPEPIAAAALAMLMVGDGAAAVIGRRYGRHRYPFSPKSVEGTLAFLATALLTAWPLTVVAMPYPPVTGLQLVVGAFTAAIVEALPIPLNDNLRVPVLTGAVMLMV